MNELLNMTAVALKKAALNEKAKDLILHNDVLYQLLKKAADRYIGGETLEEALEKAVSHNNLGYRFGIEFMGENTRTASEAKSATMEFIRAAECINSQNLNAAISLDLSHIGLSLSADFCMENLQAICDISSKQNIEVTISAEDTDKTDSVLEMYLEASKTYSNLSITVQAYLHRTKDDLKSIIHTPGRIRLVKGAFDTPPGLSLPRGNELNERYLEFLDGLLSGDRSCSIATHDAFIQNQAKALIQLYHPPKDLYEFESLYGIQTGQLSQLKEEGHPAKVYFVYGTEWYLYLCNRLAEYPPNILIALNDILGGK